MSTLAQTIESCLQKIGSDGFAVTFLDFLETLEVDQIMVFSIKADHARCLMSRHFGQSVLAGQLAAKYLDGWFRQDPLLPELRAVSPGEIRLKRMSGLAGQMSDEYRQIFFDTPGLTGKTTLLCIGQNIRLLVNLYQSRRNAPLVDADIARLVGRLVLMQFDRPAASDVPPPLAALSDRERAVCLGILSGKKAETIAGELGIAPSTAVTYRRRAYQKLGVSSRAGLFSICAR